VSLRGRSIRRVLASPTRAATVVAALLSGAVATFCNKPSGATAPPGATWPHEPAGWTVLNDYDAHAYNDGGWNSDPGYPISVVDDGTAPLSPTKVWQYKFTQGDQSLCGNGVANVFFDPSSSQASLYFGAWIKLSNPFSFPQDPEIHYVTFFTDSPSGGDLVVDIYADRVFVVDFLSGSVNYDGGAGSFSLGSWHQIEMLWIKGSSFKMWSDGVLRINFVPRASVNVTEIKIAGTWGGCTPPRAPAFDSWAWTDHVHVSRP